MQKKTKRMKGKNSACVGYEQLGPIWLGNDNWENTFDKAIFEPLPSEWMKIDIWWSKKGKTAHVVPEEHAEASQVSAL